MPRTWPAVAMKVVDLGNRYELLAPDGAGGVDVFATVSFKPDTQEVRLHDAELLAAAFLLYDVVGRLIDEVQPDGWDLNDDEGKIWLDTFCALLTARGEQDQIKLRLRPA